MLDVVQQLALSLGLGLLVGFQREWTAHRVAGIRTFALITVFGTMTALFRESIGTWLVIAGLLTVAALIIARSILVPEEREDEHGITTHMAAMVMFLVGVAVGLSQFVLALIVGGGTAALLQWKKQLHHFVGRVSETDIRAIIQFALLALVVLPILPDRAFDPYGALNPFEIWMMVVLIVGISLLGYLAAKFLGERAGTLLGGILGGFISSTATTVGYARSSRRHPDGSAAAALVIVIASTVVFLRVCIEVAVVAPGILSKIIGPVLLMMGWMAAIAFVLHRRIKGQIDDAPPQGSPTELKAAILFGVLYAAVHLAVAIVKQNFGDQALYVVAAVSGLTDMDAITLSTAQMMNHDQLMIGTGWRMILTGALTNLVFKGAAVALWGHPRLASRVLTAFGLALAGGVLLLLLWP